MPKEQDFPDELLSAARAALLDQQTRAQTKLNKHADGRTLYPMISAGPYTNERPFSSNEAAAAWAEDNIPAGVVWEIIYTCRIPTSHHTALQKLLAACLDAQANGHALPEAVDAATLEAETYYVPTDSSRG